MARRAREIEEIRKEARRLVNTRSELLGYSILVMEMARLSPAFCDDILSNLSFVKREHRESDKGAPTFKKFMRSIRGKK
jgi:hypothetical protein